MTDGTKDKANQPATSLMKGKTAFFFLAALVAGFGGGLWVGISNSQKGAIVDNANFNVKFGDKQIGFNLTSKSIDHTRILEDIFEQDFARAGTVDWLKRNQNLYSLDDPGIVQAIRALDVDHPISQQIRELKDRNVGPFAFKIDSISVGFPGAVPQGIAYVPFNSKYVGKKVEISSSQFQTRLEVFCRAAYPCTGAIRCPDVQLSFEDAEKLLPGKMLLKYENLLATILP